MSDDHVREQRRRVIAGLLVLGAPVAAWAQDTAGVVKGRGGGPSMIKGNPPKLDFGGGLIIPMDDSIFKTLWEGEDRWLTYGAAFARQETRAMEQAEIAATGTMKLMLLTQAFAPERLVRFQTCGWRSKTGDAKDLVLGDIALPGRPVTPTTDQVSGDQAAPSSGDPAEPNYRAVTGYMVMKKDAPLDYVRSHAQRLEPRS